MNLNNLNAFSKCNANLDSKRVKLTHRNSFANITNNDPSL